jgi:NAD(P)-dependent dehydrogenase (short-subunit alcohol dehydrogenase family)
MHAEVHMRDFGLQDKVVVITGGGGALGSAFARGFADSGASLALLDFNLDKAKATATSFPAEKVKAMAVAADVSKDDQVAKAIADVVKHFGTIDVLVNAAGVQIYPPKNIVDLEPGEWDLVVDICLKGMYICARHVVPILKARGGGKIVNIASIAGHRGVPGGSAYSAAKGAVINLTRQMAVELAPFKINVNSVSPGFTPTRLTTIYEYREGARNETAQGSPSGVSLTAAPLGSRGELDDYAGPVLFLSSQWANFITGVDLPVEGGRMAAR